MTSEDMKETAENRIYELGFHLAPTIAEEKLAGEVTAIKDVIEKRGGSFISEDFPKLRPLAYTMIKHIGARHLRFTTAYFGWVKFEIDPVEIVELKHALELNEHIVRFLLIKTVRESTLAVPRTPTFRSTDESKPIPGLDTKKEAVKSTMTEAELDKTIEALVVE